MTKKEWAAQMLDDVMKEMNHIGRAMTSDQFHMILGELWRIEDALKEE